MLYRDTDLQLGYSLTTMSKDSISYINIGISKETQKLYNHLISAAEAIQVLNDAKHNNILRRISQEMERPLCVTLMKTFAAEFVGKLGLICCSLAMALLAVRMRNIVLKKISKLQ